MPVTQILRVAAVASLLAAGSASAGTVGLSLNSAGAAPAGVASGLPVAAGMQFGDMLDRLAPRERRAARARLMVAIQDWRDQNNAPIVAPASVPLPASGMLLLGAIGGAAFMRRRRARG